MKSADVLLALSLLILTLAPSAGRTAESEDTRLYSEAVTQYESQIQDYRQKCVKPDLEVELPPDIPKQPCSRIEDILNARRGLLNKIGQELFGENSAEKCSLTKVTPSEEDFEDITAVVAAIEGAEKPKPSCSADQKTDLLSLQCSKEIACNVSRSLTKVILPAMLLFLPDDDSSCLKSGKQQDCISTLVQGLFKHLLENLKSYRDVLAWLGGKIAGAFSPEEQSRALEKHTTSSLLLMSSASRSWFDRLVADPKGSVLATRDLLMEKAGAVTQFIDESIRENFGCEKWSGQPFAEGSTCVQKMAGWECATCDQRLNAFCGVAGVLGAEALDFFLFTKGLKLAGTAAKMAEKPINKALNAGLKAAAAGGSAQTRLERFYLEQTIQKATRPKPRMGLERATQFKR